jgi:hypothetical protein
MFLGIFLSEIIPPKNGRKTLGKHEGYRQEA